VPARRLATIQMMVRRMTASLARPSTTSSVSPDRYGSMTTNNGIVATPLTRAESVAAVTRKSGSSEPA
jgi:hypothetical protein